MHYYKKNAFDKNKKSLSFLEILRFYFYSIYKIIGYIFLFLAVNYFNRYYIYLHSSGSLYTYYVNNIYKIESPFKVFHPKYTLLSYFFSDEEVQINEDLLSAKMSVLFINEFMIISLLLSWLFPI